MNIAWENVVSDVDLLIICSKEVIAIEVKSKRDIFKKAFLQLNRIAPFVDRTFVAKDNEAIADKFRKTKMKTGILYIDLSHNRIIVKKSANKYKIYPSVERLCYLKKCCLQELAKKFKVTPYRKKTLDIEVISTSVPNKSNAKALIIS
ncbi:hypothetical protein BH18THE2_BH18THE2_31070 [soil metagenome]